MRENLLELLVHPIFKKCMKNVQKTKEEIAYQILTNKKKIK